MMLKRLVSIRSDSRLKQDVADLPNALTKILALRPVQFHWKSDPTGPLQSGFLAQEYYQTFPQFTVTRPGDDGTGSAPVGDPWDLYEAPLMSWVVGAIKALNTAITTAASNATSALASAMSAASDASAASASASAAAASAASAIAAANAKVAETVVDGSLGTPVWAGATAPGGTITKVFRSTKQGKLNTTQFAIRCSTPGILNTGVTIPLPQGTGIGVPSDLSNQTNDSWVVQGTGGVLSGISVSISGVTCGLYKNSSGNYEIRLTATAALAANFAMGWITYPCQ